MTFKSQLLTTKLKYTLRESFINLISLILHSKEIDISKNVFIGPKVIEKITILTSISVIELIHNEYANRIYYKNSAENA